MDNRGNIPLNVGLSGTDPDDALSVKARPPVVAVGPGQAVFTKIRVRHPAPVMAGTAGDPAVPGAGGTGGGATGDPGRHHCAASGGPAGCWQGARRARGAGAARLWALVRTAKPAVGSVAKQAAQAAVAEPLAEVAARADQAAADAASARGAADARGAGEALPTPVAEAPPAAGATAFRHRFETTVAEGGTATSEPLVAAEQSTLVVTDLILQNPQGDSGRLDILVDGTEVHTEALENFRNVDYHLVTPIEVPPGEAVAIQTRCGEAGPALAPFTARSCRVFVLVIGFQRPEAPAEAVPAAGG